jgi:hypothetical protein
MRLHVSNAGGALLFPAAFLRRRRMSLAVRVA